MGCVVDHAADRNPTHHPSWGLVPALTSTLLGGVIVLVLIIASVLWLPVLATIVLLITVALALAVSGLAQCLLGHRGRCWMQRTVRWWLGPLGSLIDPFDAG